MCSELDRLQNAHDTARDIYLSAVERVILCPTYADVSEALIAYVTVKERCGVMNKHYMQHGCDSVPANRSDQFSKLDRAIMGAYFASMSFVLFFLSLLQNPG